MLELINMKNEGVGRMFALMGILLGISGLILTFFIPALFVVYFIFIVPLSAFILIAGLFIDSSVNKTPAAVKLNTKKSLSVRVVKYFFICSFLFLVFSLSLLMILL